MGKQISRTSPPVKPGGVKATDIGKEGNTKGVSSDSGGQFPFLPNASSYKGRMGGTTTGGSSNSSSKGGQFPFMPSKPGGKK